MTAVVLRGDARRLPLPDASADLIVTSPPYFGLRSYTDGGGHYDGQIGSEASPGEWVAALVACTKDWIRVLKPSGSIFVNLGDKYANRSGTGWGKESTWEGRGRPETIKQNSPHRRPDTSRSIGVPEKSLLGLPWRYALACMDELGLILRRDIIWSKPNGLPESVTDRCRSSHEYLFHFTVRPRYYAAVDEIRESYAPGTAERYRSGYKANSRGSAGASSSGVLLNMAGGDGGPDAVNPLGKLPGSVWEIASQPLTVPARLGVDHFAAFPMELPRRVILGWSPPGICTECGEGRRPVGTLPARSQEQLGAAVKASREGLGMTRAQLAERAGCGSNNVWDYEEGGHIPRGAAWDALADALGLEMTREEFTGQRDYDGSTGTGQGKWHGNAANGALRGNLASRTSRRTAITGYACACPDATAPTRPAVVVDPFGGTGTTALVASMYGRTGVSVDLSADYCRLARWRTTDPAERARALQVPKPPPVPDGQASLFDEAS